MTTTEDRWRLLSKYAGRMSDAGSTDALTQLTLATATAALGASTASFARHEVERGRVHIQRRTADDLEADRRSSDSDTMLWSEYLGLQEGLDKDVLSWRGSLDDPSTPQPARDLLVRIEKRHAAAFRVLVADTPWGDLFVTRADGTPFSDDEVRIAEVLVGLMSAGLSRLELLAELAGLAYTDPLTGLANRRAADEWLERRLTGTGEFVPLAAVLCDINGLKSINDTFGHTSGDDLLRLTAEHLTRAVEDCEDVLVARLGGDEFLLLFSGIESDQLMNVEKHLAELELPYGAGLAVGAAVSRRRPHKDESPKSAARSLLRLADAAQYQHKRARRLGIEAVHVPVSSSVQQSSEAAAVFSEALEALEDLPEQSVVFRLEAVARVASAAYDVASWWVSDMRNGPLIDVLGCLRRPDFRGPLRDVEITSGTHFDPDDFPATRAALAGGSYYASLTEGDDSERAFLGWMGYVGSLGAGATTQSGEEWLLELLADAQTSPSLHTAQATVRALVHLAVRDAAPTAL